MLSTCENMLDTLDQIKYNIKINFNYFTFINTKIRKYEIVFVTPIMLLLSSSVPNDGWLGYL